LLQPLPHHFANYIIKAKQNFVYLCGPSDIKIPCKLEITNGPDRHLLIGRGWTTYCAANNIENGDILTFHCPYNMSYNCIIVEKD
jgi:hypothetical protein